MVNLDAFLDSQVLQAGADRRVLKRTVLVNIFDFGIETRLWYSKKGGSAGR